ncbi:dTDP-4-dehydrorhamnose reductase [Achromobacter ruhlandii]|uniref:dTDP-4-dehydrorhamnose reductase n=2 Tax=Achromobacter ruhlandii TaxID=72557 RepID=A0A848NHE7_9BURK|nr:dTDP-4-dehydrorhamnose reductase [Achromobacter ruhlandii]AKP91286.1 dTDP-4-dehydrorhamnose reductase [Achromobacter xylosoxidans]AMG47342.1 dTDP-4-dehydrorhamnose reductase [Achromobacter xylosoxidans]AOU94507.1 dTDP-4-dehydrorhamnose reductase [Achromobacter ruhlandii]MCZ8434490.1 dTDP-4-dehydrorhamnose reductase [Achromobacter ruhlandii]MDC6087994.1 dTDP-4-dehydrorhamnose reductase [Achromobacter ruhlandii]
MSKKILVIGRDGQLGFELRRSLAPLGAVVAVGRGECDLTYPLQIARLVRREKPDIIVNAAAYTAVERAEEDTVRAMRVNAEAAGELAALAADRGALIVHYSSDYVFDGAKAGAYDEQDAPAPLNAYGRSKLAGEQAVRALNPAHLVFRTSWVYGVFGNSFLKTMLMALRQPEALRVVSDQRGAPTGAAYIADATALVLARYLALPADSDFPFGLYHLAATGDASWHEYACFIAQQARRAGLAVTLTPGDIRAVPSDQYPTTARRPANSRLDCRLLARTFGIRAPHWEEGVTHALAAIADSRNLA